MEVTQPINQTHVVSIPTRQNISAPGVPSRSIESIRKENKMVLVGLSIVEVLIGSLCILLGAIITGYVGNRRSPHNNYRSSSYHDLNTGEGIWCGIWILIAGGLGIGAGGKRSSRCLINSHIGFAVFGSIASGSLFILDIIRVAHIRPDNKSTSLLFGLIIPTIITSFISMIILIVSASYCCCIDSASCCESCCEGCCCDKSPHANEPQVVYIVDQSQQQQQQQLLQQQQHPITLQGFPVKTNGLGQSYVIQQLPGSQINQQTFVPVQQTSGLITSSNSNADDPPVHSLEQ